MVMSQTASEPAQAPIPSEEQVAQALQRHEKYFFADGSVTFRVEDTLFCVHRYFFETNSEYFRSLFVQNPTNGTQENPIQLRDCTRQNFERILWVFYNEGFDDYKGSKEVWLSIMDLSSQWNMSAVFDLAKRHVRQHLNDPVEMIEAQVKYKIDDDWAMDAYVKLTERRAPITLGEGEILGVRPLVILNKARGLFQDNKQGFPLDIVRRCLDEIRNKGTHQPRRPPRPQPSTHPALWPEVRGLIRPHFQSTALLDTGSNGSIVGTVTSQSITSMPELTNVSFEELRVLDYYQSQKGPSPIAAHTTWNANQPSASTQPAPIRGAA